MAYKKSKKSYNNMYEYVKREGYNPNRYGDTNYKRPIKGCVLNRYGDVVKVYVK